jgi:MFS family permease
MIQDKSGTVPPRHQLPVYGAALFSNSLTDLVPLIVPLWLVALGTSPFVIGTIVAARYIGPLLFSIHGGALMDRLGTRRVMIFFAALSAAIALLYPLASWIPLVFFLQLVGGLADSLGWVGAQTLTGQVLHGNPTYTGRLIVCTRLGTFIGPPIAGLAWVEFGAWGGFTVIALWSLGTLLSMLALPSRALPSPTEGSGATLRAAIPRYGDYLEAFRLLAIPVIGMLMMVSAIRQIGASMQGSFYAVYLDGIGVSGEVIGFLVATNGMIGIFALITGWLAHRFSEYGLLIVTSVLSVMTIAIVPFFTDLLSLFIISGVRGLMLAISVVLIVSMIARSVGPAQQGKAMGLRMTCHQAINVTVPVLMGALIEVMGIAMAFYVIGGIALVLLCGVGFFARKIATPVD